MQAKRITFIEKNKAKLVDITLREPSENEVLVKTAFSTISVGTERANIMGERNSVLEAEDAPAVFPRTVGYSSSGVVVKKGEGVKELEIGDRVVMSWSLHQDYNLLPKENVVKLTDGISLEEGALFHIGVFPMAALRKTKLEIGEGMLVMGGGILGLMAVQFAKAAGAVPVVLVDPIKERREKGLALGADFAFDPFEEGFVEKVKAATDGGAHCAIEVTGIGAGLNQTLDCMRPLGRVALLGCTRDKNFTVDYYGKVHGPGITLVGAHTNARPKWESAPHYFTQREDIQTMIKLSELRRLAMGKMIDETYSPDECEEVYARMIADKSFPAVVQFDWNGK